jgi:hypothetical protein
MNEMIDAAHENSDFALELRMFGRMRQSFRTVGLSFTGP